MKKLLLALLLLPIVILSQPNTIVVYTVYTSYWNSTTMIPDSVTYVVKAGNKIMDRTTGYTTKSGNINQNVNYLNSGYDKAYLCNIVNDPNDTDPVSSLNSFDNRNVFPLRPNCNRITWLALENYVTTLTATYGSVKVKVYWHGVNGTIGRNRITVPQYCDKEIWYGDKHEVYSIPNTDEVNNHPFTYYKK